MMSNFDAITGASLEAEEEEYLPSPKEDMMMLSST